MKLLLVAALVVLASADQICLPDKFRWLRTEVFHSSSHSGYDIMEEYFDHLTREYRFKTFANVNGEQIFIDQIFKMSEKKYWRVEGKRHGGEVKCTVQRFSQRLPVPCLLKNATIANSFFIAGDVYTNMWTENSDMQGTKIYEEVALVDNTNVPISRRVQTRGKRHDDINDAYYNFAINLPSNAFQVPSICPTELDVTQPELTVEDVDRLTKRAFFWPKEE
eukprot:NODE_1630_length_788_cov_212.183056_g1581_i0.p1 GENE.NODE_1630_length_788_cov_212.183056_g1581_i0~~NODE_1630_length_788_cov_212.183056_g1581_i0.p1  ORF type:complete len:221 (-),score=62.47 NODE_1630_length_788_cov_212.183056_g1581_i0:45-707(-)